MDKMYTGTDEDRWQQWGSGGFWIFWLIVVGLVILAGLGVYRFIQAIFEL